MTVEPDAKHVDTRLNWLTTPARAFRPGTGCNQPRPAGAEPGHRELIHTELISPVSDILVARAAERGDAIAFADGRRAISYAELDARTARLAGHLAVLGVRPGDRVAMVLGNRVETVEAYLAIIRAGAIGVPVNPEVSEDELAWLLADSGARAVLAEDGRRVPAPLVLTTATFVGLAGTSPGVRARDNLALDDIAWLLYTAGTTGRPKGVLATQRGCMWSVAACYVPALDLGPTDRVFWPVPLYHSLSHIVGVLAVTAVGAYARLVDTNHPDTLLATLAAERSTVVAGVPTTYHLLLRAARSARADPPRPRVALVGGAPTSPGLHRAVAATFGAPLVDAYGSTETSGSIAVRRPGCPVDGSCGLPVPGLTVRLVDPETRADVDDGQEGEVWVRGPNVMVGYHNQPAATAAVLTGGWYHTGDLARRDRDGFLTITGRIGELIIRAGLNIHPTEVESVLRTVPGVADAAVTGQAHETLGEVPVAYIVPGPNGVHPDDLAAACRTRLGAEKRPAYVYEITGVPRSAAGKVVRRGLPDVPARLRAIGDTHYDWLFRLDWIPSTPTAATGLRRWAVVSGPEVADAVRSTGREVVECADPPATGADVVVLVSPTSIPQVPSGTQLVVVTSGAAQAWSSDRTQRWDQAALWGWARSTGTTIVDLDDDTAAVNLPAIVAAGMRQAAIRSGVVLVPTLRRVSAADSVHAPGIPPRSSVLVAGADTPRGGLVAHHLATAYGVRRLYLVTSPGRAVLAEDTRSRIAAAGATVHLVESDTTGLPGAIPRTVGAVIYAGDLADPVVDTARVIWEHTATTAATVVFFSDVAGTLGGDLPTAAAAATIDAYATYLHAQGAPVLSLAWGSLSEARSRDAFDAVLTRTGPHLLATQLNRGDLPVDRSGLLTRADQPSGQGIDWW